MNRECLPVGSASAGCHPHSKTLFAGLEMFPWDRCKKIKSPPTTNHGDTGKAEISGNT
jgi:hypothetical protein